MTTNHQWRSYRMNWDLNLIAQFQSVYWHNSVTGVRFFYGYCLN